MEYEEFIQSYEFLYLLINTFDKQEIVSFSPQITRFLWPQSAWETPKFKNGYLQDLG